MKAWRVAILGGASVLALAGLWGVTAGQTTRPDEPVVPRVGVCDVALVFNNYRRAQDLSAEFADKARRIREEDDKRKEAIDRLRQTLDSLRPGSNEHESRLAELAKLSIERDVWRQYQEQLAMREHRRLTEEMYKEVLDAVAAVAKEKGYDLILYRERVEIESTNTAELLNEIAQRKCLYHNPAIDITQAILDRVNRQYGAKAAP